MFKWLKIIGVNTLIFMGLLLIFEVGLRFFWKMGALEGSIYQVSPNKILRYELRPGVKIKYEDYEVTVNSGGFRGREYLREKEKGVYRIVLIGDSFAFGKYVSENTLSERMELALSRICPGRKFEVLNMGVEGYNSMQELEVLKTKGLKYNPDMVVVYYCFNDPDCPEYYFKKNFINEHSMVARYIIYRIKKYLIKKDRIKRKVGSTEENFRYLYQSGSWQQAKVALLEMGDLTAAKGIKMVMLIAPEMSEPVKDFRQGYPFWYINDMLDNIKHNNIIVIDPVREFSRRNLVKADIAHWTYPNAKGNDIIAEYFIQELRKNNIKFCN